MSCGVDFGWNGALPTKTMADPRPLDSRLGLRPCAGTMDTLLRPKPSSPCVKLCVLDGATGLCEGCGRTRDEIALWGSLSEPQRRAIMTGLPERLRRAYPARHQAARP